MSALLPAVAADRAHTDYMVHCQGCHLPDGAGFPARGVPDMREVLVPFSQTEEGRAYLIQVPGARLSALPDDELAAVTNWILQTLAANDEVIVPFTAEEVARYRSIPLNDAVARRAELIEEIISDPE